jgi:hypothetical protein
MRSGESFGREGRTLESFNAWRNIGDHVSKERRIRFELGLTLGF